LEYETLIGPVIPKLAFNFFGFVLGFGMTSGLKQAGIQTFNARENSG
jgi:hypothetical protein